MDPKSRNQICVRIARHRESPELCVQAAATSDALLVDSATQIRLDLASELLEKRTFHATNKTVSAKGLLDYLAIQGGSQWCYRHDETTPNGELIETFKGDLLVCYEKDEHQRVLQLLEDAKSALATETLAKTPRQVVDDLEQFARNCGFRVLTDGTLEETSEGRQGDWLNPPGGFQRFLKRQCDIFGVTKTWLNWKQKGRMPAWAADDAGRLPSWGSKPPYWLAAKAAAHELIDARERLDGVSDEVRDTEKKAAKQAAFSRYYFQVAEELIKFEVEALEKLDDAKIMERVARRAKALDARKSAGAQNAGHASVAAGGSAKGRANKQKADAQRIAQGTNLSESRKKKAGGLVPYNAEDGFARQRDRKGYFEPADVREWLG